MSVAPHKSGLDGSVESPASFASSSAGIGSFAAQTAGSNGRPTILRIHLPCGLRRETSRTTRWAIRFFRWAKAVAGRRTMRCVFRGRPLESDMRDESPSR